MSARDNVGLGLVLVIVAAMVVAGYMLARFNRMGARSNPDVAGVQALIHDEVSAARAQDWNRLYNLGSPRLRSLCTYHDFLMQINEEGAALRMLDGEWSLYGVRVESITLRSDGETRTATYTVTETVDGHDISNDAADDPQAAVYVNGQWYDDNKGHNGCA